MKLSRTEKIALYGLVLLEAVVIVIFIGTTLTKE
jgi:hypothetical protein